LKNIHFCEGAISQNVKQQFGDLEKIFLVFAHFPVTHDRMTKAVQSKSSTRFVLLTVSTDPAIHSVLHKLYLYQVAPNGIYLQMATEQQFLYNIKQPHVSASRCHSNIQTALTGNKMSFLTQ
jgi:hypothetical protein